MNERKILIVDDEVQILEMLDKAFSGKGYSVYTASDGGEAKILFEKERPLVAFLDLNMPEITGVELCRWMKSENPVTIIHAITGYGRLFELFDCRDAGFEDYFLKPANLSLLFASVEWAFRKIDRWFEK
jgi:DNA-binding response OmpR family regulator